MCDYASPPPAEFDTGYTPQHYVEYVNQEDIQEMLGLNLPFCGWTDTSVIPNVIYIVQTGNIPAILRHELGHVRGWRHSEAEVRSALENLLK